MLRFLAALLATILLPGAALAQGKTRIEKAADLPRFTYPVEGSLESIVRDEAKFRPLAAQLHRDAQSVLDRHEIADKAATRQYLGLLATLDFLDGRYADAARRAGEARALEDKPAGKLLSGHLMRALVAAQAKTGETASQAFREEVGRQVAAELKATPYPVVSNDVMSAKSGYETLGETRILGGVREQLQPVVDKAGGKLTEGQARALVAARFSLTTRLPLKETMVATYAAFLDANKVEKADIWAARDVKLPEGGTHAPVRIAIWDSGVDTALFPRRVVLDDAGKPATIAFDRHGHPSKGELLPLPADLQARLPEMKARTKGLSDLRSNVDSPEAREVKAFLSTLRPEDYRRVTEELRLAGNYNHGTHVAGIAMEGNPHARLAVLRIDFQHTLLPDPCPSDEGVERGARNYGEYVAFLRKHGVRVVNMSFGGNVRGWESSLDLCGIGTTTEERKAIARRYFEKGKAAFTAAMASAPEILFVASAGNSNEDAAFSEATPSSIVLPNLVTVGAVDKAGDEAPFTSYGPTVKLHANGYQVESFLPGGGRVALSGTSMSAPQVTNLAAKMLAVNPKLSPVELVSLMQETAERTPDGRRILIHPARAVTAARARAS